ncbi:hypothetical protein DOTSEDRAFT_133384 [Dothistroma septosporum NZE10]|uniref:Tetrapyrrole biosynthesis uroporphyrinogen III synthase domain-containing protein n=1 Tax=Dothistroma septosporum (strain NZE10 / CBS 128990) TaxID=675120 RepID=N1PM91_DOTSN|nr:hypothetical protein DOTSEDRAFT_133384 [Dothistroma septosporum NZE10]
MDGVTASLEDLRLDQVPVYLLKTKSSPSDSYEEHFTTLSDGHYKPLFVPVLEHQLRDDTLRKLPDSFQSAATSRQLATNNPAKRYSGLIFTSQRAVDAFATVIAKLEPSKIRSLFDPHIPLYVVGPATANGVKALGLPCPILGQETGNGDALANFILKHHAGLSREVTCLNGRKLPLLFLVGEQRRDIIPRTLQAEDLPNGLQVPVTEVVVYETGEMATFEEEFTDLLKEAKAAKVKEQWVVVFSPQGCEAMLSALGWLDEKTGRYSTGRREAVSGATKTHIVTIGPTTRDFLVQSFGFEPDVCAEKPSPEGVAEGIANFGKST